MTSCHLKETIMRVYDVRPSTAEFMMAALEMIDRATKNEYHRGWIKGQEALRQDAIKAIDDLPNCPNGYSDTYDKSLIIGVIEELPSAEPKEQLIKKILSSVEDGEDCARLIELVEQI